VTYRPAFVTQRDGSPLANANCRMASIAMGLDLETRGVKRSTGSKMRSYTSDQSGGTDSGDAREAWDRGYSESLVVRDGRTFDEALDDLRAGRGVHLDVWHASAGGPCLSGTGSYGHTIYVQPDHNADGWAVGDPWCTDGFHRVTEAKLRAGAERWGSEVYGRALEEPDYPTGGLPTTDPRVLVIVRRIVKRLMDAAYPGGPSMTLERPDTGGGARRRHRHELGREPDRHVRRIIRARQPRLRAQRVGRRDPDRRPLRRSGRLPSVGRSG